MGSLSPRRRGAAAIISLATTTLAQSWVGLDGLAYIARSAAYDSQRGRLVVFSPDGGTWELDGTTPLLRRASGEPGAGPSPRHGATLVFDPARAHVLLFGGSTGTTALNDTWAWNGHRWRQLASPASPSPRFVAPVVFDASIARVVLFGGTQAATVASDTWEHDGTQWTQRAVPAPPMIHGPLLAFDEARGVCVLVVQPPIAGGTVAVLESTGGAWVPRPAAGTIPTARQAPTFTYDPGRQRCVLLGGVQNGLEAFEWDGAVWTLVTANAAPARADAVVYHDPQVGGLVRYGGWNPSDVMPHSDFWRWTGAAFALLRDDDLPSVGERPMLVHDPVRAESVLATGYYANTAATWTWDGVRWTRRSPAMMPPLREDGAMTYDLVRGTVALFGGNGVNGTLADFWGWNGTTWAPLPQTQAPPARRSAAMACDFVGGEIVLFGGDAAPPFAGPVLLSDTWSWSGTTWSQRTSPVSPPPRMAAAMAFDAGRGRVVLFGGRTGELPADQLADTWEWFGGAWHAATPFTSPPSMHDPSLVHDLATGRSLLTGRLAQGSSTVQAWSYDGTQWLFDGPIPLAYGHAATAVLGSRGNLAIYDGQRLLERTSLPASSDDLGAGCGAPAPVLTTRTRPRTGAADFGLEVRTRSGLPVLFAAAFASANVPLGNGCTLLVDPNAVTTFAVADASGLSAVAIPLPATAALRGLAFVAQSFALDPAAPGGLAATPGLHILLGD